MFDSDGDAGSVPTVPGSDFSQNQQPVPNQELPSWVVPSSNPAPLPSDPVATTIPPVPAPSFVTNSIEEKPEPVETISKPTSEDGSNKASFDIVILYLDYRQKLALGIEAPLEQWEEAAKTHPNFATKIQELSGCFRDVEKVKKEAFPETDQILARMSFHNVEDEVSRMLLTDFLWRRAINSSGKFDKELNLAKEAVAILQEMGVSDEDIRSKVNVSPSQIIEAVLSGKLRITKIN